MARNRTRIEATADEVFAVLADPYSYEHWVVGCDDIRGTDGDWPNVSSRFFHTVGVGPIKIKDSTKVIAVNSPHRLILEARARPAGIAKVIFELAPADDGRTTDVTIEEFPIRGFAKRIDNAVQDRLIGARNIETLRRLTKQVEQRRVGTTH